jgi:hypothetical protein
VEMLGWGADCVPLESGRVPVEQVRLGRLDVGEGLAFEALRGFLEPCVRALRCFVGWLGWRVG